MKKISRKQNNLKKKSRNKRIRLIGGDISFFQVYFFSNIPIIDSVKLSIKQCLISLYSSNITDIDDDDDEWHKICKNYIQQHIKEKGDKYRNKNEIYGLNIKIPTQLLGEMNDDKLTIEEDRINAALKRNGIRYKLVLNPPGVWSQELAIIAFENY